MADSSDPAGPSGAPKPLSSSAFGPPTITPEGRVPLRESVQSTSQLPVRNNVGHPVYVPDSPMYRQHFQDVLDSQAAVIQQQQKENDCLHRQMETQRKLYQDEQALWRTTQAQLQHRIQTVEIMLRQASGTTSAPRASPVNEASPVDPTLKDAGHTPMARRSMNMSTGLDGTGTGGDGSSTPKAGEAHVPPDQSTMGQQPLRRPSETQNSYSSSVGTPVDTGTDSPPQRTDIENFDDPQLEGPLGLTNSPRNERNVIFLGELDRKLSNVNLSEAAGNSQRSWASPPPSFSAGKAKQMQNADGTTFDVPESEPWLRIKKSDGSTGEAGEPEQPLRIKKSQNFGSALGQGMEVDYGKGFPGRPS